MYFHHQQNSFLDQIIQNVCNVILKTEALTLLLCIYVFITKMNTDRDDISDASAITKSLVSYFLLHTTWLAANVCRRILSPVS